MAQYSEVRIVTVDKMELLKRYKELKAQGVNITLMELKKQMDSSPEGVSYTTDTAGVSQVSNTPSVNESVSAEHESLYSTQKTESSPAYVSSFAPQPQEAAMQQIQSQTPQYQHYQSQFEAASSAFQPSPLPTQIPLPQTELVKYSGNVSISVSDEEPKLQKYALIGYPLGHSLSTFIHKAGFKSLGLDSTYDILETPPDSLVDRIKYLKSNNFAGFNVTIPLKLPVTLFLDEVDSSADVVGAVNTVVINPDKTMKGYNTDVIGFRNAIPDDVILAGKVAGVLGTGGAARAAITALAQSQVRKIKVFTRNIPNCSELMTFLRSKFPLVEFEVFQIERIRDLSDVDILVNTTPIGMQGRAADLTPVEEPELRTLPMGAIVYDVIYNPKKTVLLKLAEKNGYRIISGVDMFIHQALAAEQIWTGKTPDFKDMKIAALENL